MPHISEIYIQKPVNGIQTKTTTKTENTITPTICMKVWLKDRKRQQ